VIRRFSDDFAIQCVASCEPVECQRHGCADVVAVFPPPLLANLPVEIRERLAHDRVRSFLAELGSQSFDEWHQDLSLDLDLLDQRDVRTSLLLKRS
jgi:hypothetical protein